MKKLIASLALIALMAGSALAVDIAKSPNLVIEGTQNNYADVLSSDRGNVAVVSIIDGTFTDLAPLYAEAITYCGCTPDLYYDPAGSIDYTGYDLVLADCSDNWWYSMNYPMEINAWAAYMDTGGRFILVGQDFLYGSGDYAFTTNYCGMTSVSEDVNYADDSAMTWTGTDVLGYMGDTMSPCFASNDWFTDDVSGDYGVCDWGTVMYPGPYGGGSASMVGIFSVVEFGCGNILNDVVGAMAAWLIVTPTEDLSVSTLKALY